MKAGGMKARGRGAAVVLGTCPAAWSLTLLEKRNKVSVPQHFKGRQLGLLGLALNTSFPPIIIK